MAPPPDRSLSRAPLAGKRLLVCAGPGGVGKTTTAAALAVAAARSGQRVLVCTIDPAPRLVDALRLPELGPEPRLVPPEIARALGIAGAGELRAARLDTEHAFQRLVEAEIASPADRARIFANSIYKQITRNLTGALEHAATLALHELYARGGFDVFVLDTPPTSNALDFLEAPRKLAEFITSPTVGWLTRRNEGGFFSAARLGAGGAFILRRLAKLAGSQFLDDVGAFLVDFQAVLGGFLSRAQTVDRLLRGPDVAALLVFAAEAPSVDEALGFHTRLVAAGLPPAMFVANRTIEPPGAADPEAIGASLDADSALADLDAATRARAAQVLAETAVDLASLADGQLGELARIRLAAPETPLARVPLLAEEAGSLEALAHVVLHLLPSFRDAPSLLAR